MVGVIAENKVYANLIIHDDSKSKPSESDCTTGLANLQSDYDSEEANKIAKKESAKLKLTALGLDEDEINSIIG